jgi:hypothetical protein
VLPQETIDTGAAPPVPVVAEDALDWAEDDALAPPVLVLLPPELLALGDPPLWPAPDEAPLAPAPPSPVLPLEVLVVAPVELDASPLVESVHEGSDAITVAGASTHIDARKKAILGDLVTAAAGRHV